MKEAGGAELKAKKKRDNNIKSNHNTSYNKNETQEDTTRPYFLSSLLLVAPESARKIAAKNRSPMPTGIGGSFQLANSASPLGVIDSASAPTARIKTKATRKNRVQTDTA